MPAPQGRSNQAVPTCPRGPVPSCPRARVPPTPPRLCALRPARCAPFVGIIALVLPCSYLVLTREGAFAPSFSLRNGGRGPDADAPSLQLHEATATFRDKKADLRAPITRPVRPCVEPGERTNRMLRKPWAHQSGCRRAAGPAVGSRRTHAKPTPSNDRHPAGRSATHSDAAPRYDRGGGAEFPGRGKSGHASSCRTGAGTTGAGATGAERRG